MVNQIYIVFATPPWSAWSLSEYVPSVKSTLA